MSKNIRFCFRVDKSIGLEKDEQGNNKEAYVCCKECDADSYNMSYEEYKELQIIYRKVLSENLRCDIKLIEPITLNEYLDNTEEKIE